MPSNNNSWLLAALLPAPLLLTACGGGYRDPPGLEPAPPQPRTYPSAPDYPISVDPRYAGPGTSYPVPGDQPRRQPPQNLPARELGPGDVVDGTNLPAPAEYPPTRAPAATPAVPAVPLPAEQRYDNVGYAMWAPQTGTIAAAHRLLPPGSFAEVTALDSGKTILVPITARANSNREIELSGAAAQLLGLTGDSAAVRVRRIVPTAADQNLLRAGQPAQSRFDTPPVLLRALRSRLAQNAAPAPPAAAPAVRTPIPRTPIPRTPTPRAPVPPHGAAGYRVAGYYVQLAALSTNARAATLARAAGAAVHRKGTLWLVRSGPFDDLRSAQAARDGLARRGYGDARIVKE